MKKTVIRIFALLLAAIMVLSLGVTAFAAEMDFGGGTYDALAGNNFDDFANEAVENASGSGSHAGIFALSVKGEKEYVTTAFLLERDGSVYLVTSSFFQTDLAAGALTLSSTGGNYSQKATLLGVDGFFAYLSASGLENFAPFKVSGGVYKSGRLYVEQIGEGLGYLELNIGEMDIYNMDTGDFAIFNTGRKAQALEIGSPIIDWDTFTVFAIGSAGKHPESGDICPVYFSFVKTPCNEGYALGSGGNSGSGGNGGGGGSTETEPTDNGGGNGGNGGNNGGGDSGNNGGGNSGNNGGGNSGGFEFKPIYLLYIGIVAVVVFLIVRSNTRGGDAGAKPGTVALERTDAVQGGETLPLDPIGGNQGTLPLDPNFNPMPVMTAWQLRAVGGSFNGQTFPISGTLRLGRAPQCQVVFPAGTPGISSNHCEVTMEGGSVVLRDLGSSYGTFCKGNKLAPHATCYLNPGDTFTMAQSQTFQLEAAGAAAPVQSAAPIAVRDSQGREYRTGSGRMAFGRASGNKVQFPAEDKSVSSNHCVLYREGGKLFLMDVGSTNGTFINEKERLQPNVPYRVRKGMVFFLTNRKNTFVVVED